MVRVLISKASNKWCRRAMIIVIFFFLVLPVVMRADLIAAGDQWGCADLRRATTPDTWGHDIEVPDRKFQFTDRLSIGNEVGGTLGGHAANILIPGAVMSGCFVKDINLSDLGESTDKYKTTRYGQTSRDHWGFRGCWNVVSTFDKKRNSVLLKSWAKEERRK